MRLLDTNACIQLWQRKNLTVRRHFMQYGPTDLAMCSVVKAELLFVALSSKQRDSNLQLLNRLFQPLISFEFNDLAAVHYAEIRDDLSKHGNLIGANDLMIAAIAKANNAILITNNTREFSRVNGLKVEDWEADS